MTAIPRLCLASLLLAQGAALSAMTQADLPKITSAERIDEFVAAIPAAKSAPPRVD